MARSESPSISVSRRGAAGADPERTVVWVRGDHDIATKVSLSVTIARAAQLEEGDLLVDLSGVTFMDASTVDAIVRSADRLRSRAQSLEIRAPSPPARRILELCAVSLLVSPGATTETKATDHPTGTAAALGTWIDVPATRPARAAEAAESVESVEAAEVEVGP